MPSLKQLQLLNSLLKKVEAPVQAAEKTQLWHSSPHRFNKFDLSKIGSGEGNQSFGHGIYLAESPAVSGPTGQYFEKFKKHPSAAQSGGPYAYKVEVPNQEIEKMLDWDKTLAEQNPFVDTRLNFMKEELRNAGVLDDYLERKNADWHELTGGEFFRQIMNRAHMDDALPELTDLNPYRPNEATSKFLQNLGVPGVKYLDQLSRGAQDGTRNIVTFSDELPRIIERNGLPINYAAGGAIKGYAGGKIIKGGLGLIDDILKGTKAATKEGKPVDVYHGGSWPGDKPFMGDAWFTETLDDAQYYADQLGTKVQRANLNVRNPYIMTPGKEEANEVVRTVDRSKYDAVYDPAVGDWIVWDPTRIFHKP